MKISLLSNWADFQSKRPPSFSHRRNFKTNYRSNKYLWKRQETKKSQTKVNSWKDISKKDIESFLGIIILMRINDLPKMRLYWSKDFFFVIILSLQLCQEIVFFTYFVIYIWSITHWNENENLRITVEFAR
jgi:hypothetical protein